MIKESPCRLEVDENNTQWMEVEHKTSSRPPPCTRRENLHKKGFIDDLTLLERISLKDLVQKEKIIGPLNYHDRYNLTLPPQKSILQHQLQDLKVFTDQHHMKLNSKKTKCIPFNTSKSKDFMPQLQLEDGSYLEVIYQLKLVGLVINSQLSWSAHVDYTVKRVNKILWQLTRFKQIGASQDKLVQFYTLKIRSILMFGSACFHSSLSAQLSQLLELQQKRSFVIILGSRYQNYTQARNLLNLPRLDTLREEVCLKWALKAQRDPKHSHLFPLSESIVNTRHKNKFKEYFCRTSKYYNSSVPYMTRALNKHNAENKKTSNSL